MLSYNLNILPFGAGLFGGVGHDHASERLSEFVIREEIVHCDVLLLQEVFATPLLRSMLCQQQWLRARLSELGFVHQASCPLLYHFLVARLEELGFVHRALPP